MPTKRSQARWSRSRLHESFVCGDSRAGYTGIAAGGDPGLSADHPSPNEEAQASLPSGHDDP